MPVVNVVKLPSDDVHDGRGVTHQYLVGVFPLKLDVYDFYRPQSTVFERSVAAGIFASDNWHDYENWVRN